MSNKLDKQEIKLVDITEGKIKPTKEELRRIVREAALTETTSRIYVDPKYQTPGKRLRIDNTDAATHQNLLKLGYRPVFNTDIKVGSGSLSEPHSMGGNVYVELSINGEQQKGMLYEIDEDLYQARKEYEAELNDQQLEQKIEDGGFEDLKTRRSRRAHK